MSKDAEDSGVERGYRALFCAVCRYRNVSRGWRAEDKTKELPDVSDEEVAAYEAELRLKVFEIADRIEANFGSPPGYLVSGLAVRESDCDVTRTIRAALYATDLEPSEDDVIGLTIAIKEDLLVREKRLRKALRRVLMATTLEVAKQVARSEIERHIDDNAARTGD